MQNQEEPVRALCENCGQPARLRCSRCKAFPVCDKKCMAAVWRRHKPDCDNLVASSKKMEEAGATVSGVPFELPVESFQRLNARMLEIYSRHGIEEPPERGSTMDVEKKLAFFLDVLREHDTSSQENRNLPMPEKLLLNRRYNNTYRHAVDTFTGGEINQLNELMRRNHVGAYNP